jgi:hypothetical protein
MAYRCSQGYRQRSLTHPVMEFIPYSRVLFHAMQRFLALALLSLACSGSPPRRPITDPHLVLRGIRDRESHVQGLRAHGSADHFGAQGRIRGEVYVFVSRPNVRVDTRAFGNTVSTIISNGRTFAMSDFRGGTHFVGDAVPCVASQLLGVSLEAGEVVALLAGGPPILDGDSHIRWDNDHYVVDITGSNHRSESLHLTITNEEHDNASPEQQHPRPVRAELSDARGLRAVLTFEDYDTVSGVAFPKRVRVLIERDNVDLVVRYNEVSINPELPEDTFDQAPPNEALRVETVRCTETTTTAAPRKN